MIDTTRITSGFDIEINLGAGWILTALRALHEAGRLLPEELPPPFPPDAELTIDAVEINPDGPRDITVTVTVSGVPAPLTILASLELQDGEDGTELVVDTTIPNTDPIVIPFDALTGLAGTPVLRKLRGDDGIDPSFAVLANLDMTVIPQDIDPDSEEGQDSAEELSERGNEFLAQSFLPTGSDIALGLATDNYPRFANDIWHTELRADDGSHPLPDEEDRRGEWNVVRMNPRSNGLRVVLKGTVPIDLFPDGEVTVTVDLVPHIEDGGLKFGFEIDTDIDTGLLGDLWAATLGGFAGLILGFLIGIGVGIGGGAILGVVALEVAEVIVNGEVRRQVRAQLEDEPPGPVLACADDRVIVEAVPHPDEDSGIALGPLDAIPRSIPIDDSNPDLLHTKYVLVTTNYTDITTDRDGFAAAGTATAAERFVPRRASLVRMDTGDDGPQLVYETLDPDPEEDEPPATLEVALALDEVIDRASAGNLNPPLRLHPLPGEADESLVDGKVPSVCLRATNVRRAQTVVTDIRFDTGLELTVPEAVALQDAGAIVVTGTQLIHPRNARPYFRAFPDGTTENNFENLPTF